MSRRITNEIVDIPLNGGLVKGILNGDETSWNFQSLSMEFLALFTGGIVHSHTYLGVSTMQNEQERAKLAIAAHLKALLEERRAAAPKPRAAAYPTYAAQQHRRIVVP